MSEMGWIAWFEKKVSQAEILQKESIAADAVLEIMLDEFENAYSAWVMDHAHELRYREAREALLNVVRQSAA